MSGQVRVDKWLWSVRAFKTRSAATDACTTGRILVNGEVAKPATKVAVGDEVTARRRDRTLVYGVVEVIEKRVGAARAAECYDDRSPPVPESGRHLPNQGVRLRGQGRPTKRDRRQIDRFRGR